MRLGLAFIGGVVAVMAGCGPAVGAPDDESDGASSSGAPGDTDVAGDTDDVEDPDASTTADSAGGGGAEVPMALDGITVDEARHSYQCIDGCESFYSDDFLRLTLTSERTQDVVVTWHDWTKGTRELVVDDEPMAETTAHLEAGVPTDVRLQVSYDGFCSMQEWNEPARILFNVDDALVEVEGTSSAGYGWDC